MSIHIPLSYPIESGTILDYYAENFIYYAYSTKIKSFMLKCMLSKLCSTADCSKCIRLSDMLSEVLLM